MAGLKKEGNLQQSKPQNVPATRYGFRFYTAVIGIFSFALYFNTLFNDYNLDDELVTQNHRVTGKGWDVVKFNFDAFSTDSSFSVKLKNFLPAVFRVPYYEDNAGYKYEYRPMVLLSFAIEHMLFAKKETIAGNEVYTDQPGWSHLINVLLYALLCVLLFVVLKELLRKFNIAFPFLITLFFAAHPIHTEVVASIKNRDEILALLFALLSLYSSIKYVQGRRVYFLLLVPVFLVLGILSKPTIITFALLIPLSLVMLTEVTYLPLMLLTTLLVLPTVFFSRLYSVTEQVELTLVLYLAVNTFFLLKHFGFFISQFRQLTVSAYRDTWVSDKNPGLDIPLEKGFGIQFLSLLGLGIVILLTLLIAVPGLYMGKVWMSIIPLIILVVIYLSATPEAQLVFITPIALVLLLAVIKFHPITTAIEAVLIVFLVNHITGPSKAARVVGIINYVVYSLVVLIALHSFHFLAIVFFIGFFYRRLLPLTGIIMLVLLLAAGKNFFGMATGASSFKLIYLNWPIMIAAALLLWKHKEQLLNKISVASMPVVLLLYLFFAVHITNNDLTRVFKENYYKGMTTRAANPAPVQSVRPLRFVEYPLDEHTARSIKLGTAMVVLGKYLKLVAVPYPMSYYYGFAYITPEKLANAVPIFFLLIHAALLLWAIYFFRTRTLLSYSILFYLISVSVFSNLVLPVPGLMGDRFLLIPSIGFSIFLTLILVRIFKLDLRDPDFDLLKIQMPAKATLLGLLVIYSGITVARNFDWKDQLTLFKHDISAVENSAQAHNLLALHLLIDSHKQTDSNKQKEELEQAAEHFKRAVEIYPNFLNAQFDLARTYEALQRYDDAYTAYKRATEIDTTFVVPYFSMAVIQHNKHNLPEAVNLYEKFLKVNYKSVEGYANLSFAYFTMGNYEKSIEVNHRALNIDSNSLGPVVNIGKTYLKMGKVDSALFYFKKAQRINPNDPNISAAVNDLSRK